MLITLHRILFHIFFITVNTERKYLPVWETKTLFVHQRLLAWLKNDHFLKRQTMIKWQSSHIFLYISGLKSEFLTRKIQS